MVIKPLFYIWLKWTVLYHACDNLQDVINRQRYKNKLYLKTTEWISIPKLAMKQYETKMNHLEQLQHKNQLCKKKPKKYSKTHHWRMIMKQYLHIDFKLWNYVKQYDKSQHIRTIVLKRIEPTYFMTHQTKKKRYRNIVAQRLMQNMVFYKYIYTSPKWSYCQSQTIFILRRR